MSNKKLIAAVGKLLREHGELSTAELAKGVGIQGRPGPDFKRLLYGSGYFERTTPMAETGRWKLRDPEPLPEPPSPRATPEPIPRPEPPQRYVLQGPARTTENERSQEELAKIMVELLQKHRELRYSQLLQMTGQRGKPSSAFRRALNNSGHFSCVNGTDIDPRWVLASPSPRKKKKSKNVRQTATMLVVVDARDGQAPATLADGPTIVFVPKDVSTRSPLGATLVELEQGTYKKDFERHLHVLRHAVDAMGGELVVVSDYVQR